MLNTRLINTLLVILLVNLQNWYPTEEMPFSAIYVQDEIVFTVDMPNNPSPVAAYIEKLDIHGNLSILTVCEKDTIFSVPVETHTDGDRYIFDVIYDNRNSIHYGPISPSHVIFMPTMHL